MRPKAILNQFVAFFNKQDYEGIALLYHEDAINHQTPIGLIEGKENIKQFFKAEFKKYEMICLIENIFEDGEVGILEWIDLKGLRGCGFFWIKEGKIIKQRGYWDRLAFMEQQKK